MSFGRKGETDMYDRCIWCDRYIHESPDPFCSEDHKKAWLDAEHEQELEIEREEADRMSDPNEGCWSYSW